MVVAQSATTTPAKQQPDKSELPVIKDKVVVTATRGELTQEQTPNSTSVVTLQENRIRNTPTLDQSLNLLEGVFAFRAKGLMDNEARIMMRGFGNQNRTLILLDGQPLNDGYTGNVLWTMLPVNEVERVEVARGPFSSLYGGNAMGGVVNILTRPIERRAFEASAQYGTFNTTNYHARYSDRFYNRLGVSIGYQRLQTGGYSVRPITASATTGTGGTLVTGVIPSLTLTGARTFLIGASGDNWHNQHAVRLKSDLTLTSHTQLTGQYIRQNSAYGYDNYTSFLRDAAGNVVDRGPVQFDDNGVLRRFNFTPGSFLQIPGHALAHFVSGSLLHRFNARALLQVSAGTSYQPDVQFRSPAIATATQAGGPGVASDRTSRNSYFNTQFNWQPEGWGKRQSFVFGAETRQDFSNALEFNLTNWQDKGSVTNQIYEALGRTFNQAIYAQDTLRLRENITVVAGLRYDYWRTYDGFYNGFTATTPLTKYDERSNTAVTGKVAAAWQVGAGFTARASVGTAFRNPTVLDMYRSFRFSSGTLFLGNPALKPERLFSYEFGARQQLGHRTTLEATYFRNQITDLIYRKTDLAADPTGNIRLNVNAGAGTTNGVELAARQQLNGWLQLRGSYSYTNAIISQNPFAANLVGKRIPFIPEHTAAASLLGAWRRLTGSLNARYVGATFSTDTNTDITRGVFGAYDPFLLVDASFGVEIGRSFTLFTNADNLLNRRYYQFFQSPGRAANIGLRWRK